jgi:neutral ceramidase
MQTEKVIETLKYKDDIVLDWRSRHLKIPISELNPTEIEEAQKILAENPEPVWTDSEHKKVDPKWIYAAILVDRYKQRQRNPEYDCEIQVLRVGNAAFVGWPGEPFVEGGLQVKLRSPAFPTYIVHNTSTLPSSVGYLPTKQAFERGGHEITWSRLVPEALDIIVDATIDLLKELFQE